MTSLLASGDNISANCRVMLAPCSCRCLPKRDRLRTHSDMLSPSDEDDSDDAKCLCILSAWSLALLVADDDAHGIGSSSGCAAARRSGVWSGSNRRGRPWRIIIVGRRGTGRLVGCEDAGFALARFHSAAFSLPTCTYLRGSYAFQPRNFLFRFAVVKLSICHHHFFGLVRVLSCW